MNICARIGSTIRGNPCKWWLQVIGRQLTDVRDQRYRGARPPRRRRTQAGGAGRVGKTAAGLGRWVRREAECTVRCKKILIDVLLGWTAWNAAAGAMIVGCDLFWTGRDRPLTSADSERALFSSATLAPPSPPLQYKVRTCSARGPDCLLCCQFPIHPTSTRP